MKKFNKIMETEKYIWPTSIAAARRLQGMHSEISIDFILDLESQKELCKNVPFTNMTYTFMKKIAEQILIANDSYHRRTDKTKMELMNRENYRGFRNDSFYSKKWNKDKVNEENDNDK